MRHSAKAQPPIFSPHKPLAVLSARRRIRAAPFDREKEIGYNQGNSKKEQNMTQSDTTGL